MKKRILVLVATVVLTSAACFADDSMTCGTNLVSVGDLKPAILEKCGEPVLKEDIGGGGTRERWTYDLGVGSFLKVLTFGGDRLESIDDSDKALGK